MWLVLMVISMYIQRVVDLRFFRSCLTCKTNDGFPISKGMNADQSFSFNIAYISWSIENFAPGILANNEDSIY